jgi:hypothetical protein
MTRREVLEQLRTMREVALLDDNRLAFEIVESMITDITEHGATWELIHDQIVVCRK